MATIGPMNRRTPRAKAANSAVRAVTSRCADGKLRRHNDWLAVEEPLEIRIRGKAIAITMRTPGHDAELAAGFLVTEGLLKDRQDLIAIVPCEQAGPEVRPNTLNIFLPPRVKVRFKQLTRHVFASSSCGICGKASIEAVHQHFPRLNQAPLVPQQVLLKLPGRLRRAQPGFAKTGGLHAAGLFDAQGNLLVAREDVGRHNAVDKVIGHEFLAGRLPCDQRLLMVSGRISFEIMQKALAARIPIVCAVSAPTNLAVEFARESGQTLIGFLRGSNFNRYSN